MLTLDAARRDQRYRSGSMVETRRGAVHAVVRGQGPDVVLLHGVTDNASTWHDLQAALPHVRTHALDLLGHGLTDIPDGTPDQRELCEWVAAYLDAAEVESAVVVGWSLGGTCTLELAAAHPARVRAMVLVGAAALDFPFPLALTPLKVPPVGELMPAIGSSDPVRRTVMRSTFARRFHPSQDVIERYFRGWHIRGRARFMRRLLSGLHIETTARVLPRIQAPAWIVHGEEDQLVPVGVARELAARLPRTEASFLSGVGHAPHIERPQSVLDAIGAALG
jgi:pimeloyl-ACP methyl ester carboxylesterase